LVTKQYVDSKTASTSYWTQNNTTVYPIIGTTYQNVAIGKNSATVPLDVSGNANISGLINANGGLTVPVNKTLTITGIGSTLAFGTGATVTNANNAGLVDTTTTQTIGGTKTFSSPITGSISGNAATATNLVSTGGANQIPYQTASSTTGFITAGTANQVLTYNASGAPSWQASGSNLWTSSFGVITPTTASNSLQIGTSSSASTNGLSVYGPITTSQTINNSFFSASSVYENYSLFIGEYTTADTLTNIKGILNSSSYPRNTGIGSNALASSSTQTSNCTAVGVFSMSASKANSNCTAIGASSGTYDISGKNNTYLGASTGQLNTDKNIYNNSTAIGYNSVITASNQIVLGTSTENVSIPGKVNNTSIIYKNILVPTVTGSPTISTSGTYSVYTFTVSGTIQFHSGANNVKFGYIVVGGGGGGGGGVTGFTSSAGGGAGGAVVYCPISSGPSFVGGTTYTITVGGGGNGGQSGQNGNTGGASSIGSFATALGGEFGSKAPSQNSITADQTLGSTTGSTGSTGSTILRGGNGGGNTTTGKVQPITSDTLNNMSDINGYYYTTYSGGGGCGSGNISDASACGGFGGKVNPNNTAVIAGVNGSRQTPATLTLPTTGAPNTGSGGGGGFGAGTTVTPYAGAAGGSGVVIIYFSKDTSSYTNSLYYDSIGNYALGTGFPSITTGSNNLSLGYQALNNNTSGNSNVAVGNQSLSKNLTGVRNIAIGYQSLGKNTDGSLNTAIGYQALFENTTGTSNVAVGNGALSNSTIGSNKTSIGFGTAIKDISGNNNTYLGYKADVSSNTVIYNNSTAIGYNSKITASNQIVLGTANETVYIPGQINYNFVTLTAEAPSYAGSTITTINSNIYFINANELLTSYNGSIFMIDLPSPTSSSGKRVLFRKKLKNTTFSLKFQSNNSFVFIDLNNNNSAVNSCNSINCTEFFCDGIYWYQLFNQ
jgi:hypothetical protein